MNIAGLRVTNASPHNVVTRDACGKQQAYLRTAIGWRRGNAHLHAHDGDLVTDPALGALLDSAASASDRT